MKKIEEFANDIDILMLGVNDQIRSNVFRTLVVLVWSSISPSGEGAPSLEYVISRNQDAFFVSKPKTLSNEETNWNIILNNYGFYKCDEFALIMADGIKNGYFDQERIKLGVNEYLINFERFEARKAIEAAWRPFHDSFDNNSLIVVQSIVDAYSKNIKYTNLLDIDSAVKTLKKITNDDQWRVLLKQYFENNPCSTTSDEYIDSFGRALTDLDVIAACKDHAMNFPDTPRSPTAAALKIYHGIWNEDDEILLAALDVSDFVKLFTEAREPDRFRVIQGCLEFRKTTPLSERGAKILDRANQALISIGKKSPLNALRMRRFDVNVPKTP